MAIFTLLVTKSPFDHQDAWSAYRFANAAIQQGHDIAGVFFYQSGVLNSNGFISGHSDEVNMLHKWQSLASEHNVPLQVCVTAANRRGVINQLDAEEMDGNQFNLHQPFEEVGLGDLCLLLNSCDRMIQF